MDVLDEFWRGRSAVSAGRRRAQQDVVRAFIESVPSQSFSNADGDALQEYLAARGERGCSPGTLRKERGMILSFFTWAWRNGHVSADTLLSLRTVAPPEGSMGVAQPQPYKRWEIQELWRTLDERWPRLPSADAARWLSRWQDGRSPYSHVRADAIHLQLEAIIGLAIACVMRRGEIYRCSVLDLHPENEYIPVRRGDVTLREAPHTRMAREKLAAWLEIRAVIAPPHDRPWLNLWAENTVRRPMTVHVFEKLLATYVGEGWTFRRLRDTGAVEWLRAGLPVWLLREMLGHRSMKDTLPYLESAGGDVHRKLDKVEGELLARGAHQAAHEVALRLGRPRRTSAASSRAPSA